MKFSTREDIEAPIDHVFAQVSDFDGFERSALRFGAEAKRIDSGPIVVGSAWDIAFGFRGRARKLHAVINTLEQDHGYLIDATSNGMEITTEVSLMALSRKRTRIVVAIDLRAKTLTARLVLQSMKLAKAKMSKRFKVRVLEYAEDLEEAYRKGA